MLSANKTSGNICFAPETKKQDGPFYCPACSSGLILRKGQKRIHHFAHTPDSVCDLRGESFEHMATKWHIYQSLLQHPDVLRAKTEVVLRGVRADVVFKTKRNTVAIEIQKSKLSNEEIISRSGRYTALKIPVIWLTNIRYDEIEQRASPAKWQKLLHGMYFGRVYTWLDGLVVQATHFDDYEIWKESYDSYEYGEVGGYFQASKRYRKLNDGPQLNIVDDFAPYSRSAWKTIPAALLWKDTKPNWWNNTGICF